jgi:hypothetical protein
MPPALAPKSKGRPKKRARLPSGQFFSSASGEQGGTQKELSTSSQTSSDFTGRECFMEKTHEYACPEQHDSQSLPRRSKRLEEKAERAKAKSSHEGIESSEPSYPSFYTRYHMWKEASKMVRDLRFLKDLTKTQYADCLLLVHNYLSKNNSSHGFADAGCGVQIDGDWDIDWEHDRKKPVHLRGFMHLRRYGSERERYNGRQGGRFFKWYAQDLFHWGLRQLGVTEACMTEDQCMGVLAGVNEEVRTWPEAALTMVPYSGPQCYAHFDPNGDYRGAADTLNCYKGDCRKCFWCMKKGGYIYDRLVIPKHREALGDLIEAYHKQKREAAAEAKTKFWQDFRQMSVEDQEKALAKREGKTLAQYRQKQQESREFRERQEQNRKIAEEAREKERHQKAAEKAQLLRMHEEAKAKGESYSATWRGTDYVIGISSGNSTARWQQ